MLRAIQVFEFIRRYIADNGWAPTYQEIADAVGLKSKSDVGRYLTRLEEKGLIKKGNGSRMIAITGALPTSKEKEAACVSKSKPSSCRVLRSNKR